jgi:O-antigen/teichoic acid export membrane protein
VWLPIFTLLWSLLLMLEHYLNSQLKIALSVMMREVVLRIANIGVIILFVAGYINFDWFVIGSVLIYLIPIVFLWVVCAKTEGFGISFNWKLINRDEYKDIIHFAWYHTLMGISLNLLGYLDALMLAPLDKNGVSSVAEYSIAVFIITIMQIPYRGMGYSALPDLTKAYEAKDMLKVENLFKRAGINILIVAVGMWLVIVLNMHNAVLILNKGYESVTMLVLILSLGKLVDMATGLNNEMISVSKHYKFNFYISLVLVALIFVFNRILIPIYGVYGAALGTTLALVCFNIAKFIFLWSKMRLQPFTKGSIWVIVAGVGAGFMVYWLPFIFNPFVDAFVRSGLILVLYGVLLIVFKPSDDLNHFLASVKKNKRLF